MAALIADLTITIVAVFCDVFFFQKMNTFFAMLSLPLLLFKAVDYSVCRAKRDKFILNYYCFARRKNKDKIHFSLF